MGELLVVVGALLVIAAAAVLGPRLRVAAPLMLVLIGVGASFLPVFDSVAINPELILAGVLPPLLYSSAVSMPTMNFRREFGAISGLSVLLVLASSLLLGLFFVVAIPDLGFAWGVALGAVVSPTDAVATSIIKQTPVSKRVVAMLDGESLLNDPTALVLLRTSIAAAAVSFSVWRTLGTFVYSVVVAVIVGWAVGRGNLLVRRRVTDPTVNTVISFTVPFVASIPAEAIGASGLVAAVIAGLVTGIRAPRDLSPRNRLSDSQNWRTVELVLEGAVFLTMGVQIKSIVTDVEDHHAGVGTAVLVAVGALVLTVVVRAAYIAPLLAALGAKSRRYVGMQDRLEDMQVKMQSDDGRQATLDELNTRPGRTLKESDLDRFSVRVTRGLADIEYFRRQPLGWRDGTVVVWAGMRGAVTVAAAQTLPADTPQRPVLVLVAFAVALLSLVVQGGTIGPLVRWISRGDEGTDAEQAASDQAQSEQARIFDLLREASEQIPEPPGVHDQSRAGFAASRSHRLAVLGAQRTALLDARDNGTFDADVLESALANLDASEIAIELRGKMVT
ncbi:cation:proton antiporter [Cellulomonas sp. JH27-2]|uniref:cation:proton antiporter n=1 Tax=Cellulomonas sp. JH27-2 TaxID=2774139 RepID=UPI00177E38C8|nr:cation:proton antiporter [Cellulomonas sp. JH27-2]MBD8058218.1 cation:proton antiporter [Cellulomonas sp. JH27-2]